MCDEKWQKGKEKNERQKTGEEGEERGKNGRTTKRKILLRPVILSTGESKARGL